MATDPDRQSDGRPSRQRRRPLSALPGGLHVAFQAAWLLAIAFPMAAKASELAARPAARVALSIVELTAAWAVVATLTWGLQVLALTTSGRFGARTRSRVREAGRRKAVAE